MKKHFGLIHNLLIATASIFTSSVLNVEPIFAATFAVSNSEVEIENFSQIPSDVATFTNTETLTNATDGMVRAIANTDADFLQIPPFATNANLSLAFGENQAYLALAESQSEIIGNFEIEEDTNFSFDFSAFLNLETSIDNPSRENARASGDISLLLFDIENNSILDFVNLTGNLTTEGENDFIALQTSDTVNINQAIADSNFGGKEEFLVSFVEGSVERYFADETNLALIEFKRNRVRVKASEPSINLALLVSSGVIGLVLKPRRK